ncbi:hypothetical protein QUF58_03710 [Anaerolineales bacterium HSG24]|nr:hypothetical protein [Anaerolineales bacterium HSG24]
MYHVFAIIKPPNIYLFGDSFCFDQHGNMPLRGNQIIPTINRSILLTLILIYLIAFWLTPKTVFWSPDEGAKFLELQTLYRLQQQDPHPLPYQGTRIDPTGQFYPSHTIYPRLTANNDLDFHWPVWFSLLSVWPFQLGGVTAIYLLPWLSGLGVAYLSGQIAARLDARAFAPTVLLVGLATPIFFYSLLFWEHTFVVMLGLLALRQALNFEPKTDHASPFRYSSLLRLVLFLITGIALRLEMLFYAVALLIALISVNFFYQPFPQDKIRRLALPVIGLISIGLLVIMTIYQYNLFGSRYLSMLAWGGELLQQPDFWANSLIHLQAIWINSSSSGGPLVEAWLSRWGLVCLLLIALAISLPSPGRELGVLLAGVGFVYLSLTVLMLPTPYRTLHGFFLPAPYLLFMGLFWNYYRQFAKSERFASHQAKLIGLTTLWYLILGTVAVMVRQAELLANLEWGARYLLMLYPLATVCTVVGVLKVLTQSRIFSTNIALALDKSWRYALFSLMLTLVCIGVGYQWRGFTEIQTTKQPLLAYAQQLEQSLPIVTDIEWLYASLSPHLITKEVYVIEPQTEIKSWLVLTETEIDKFLFASFFELSPQLLTDGPYPVEAVTHWQVKKMNFTIYRRIKQKEQQ